MSTNLIQATNDPKLLGAGLFYKKEFYQKASNFLDAVSNYADLIDINIDFEKTKVANDPVTAQADFFSSLDTKLSTMQPQFAANWIDVFNKSLSEVKTQVFAKIGTGTFFKSFSDCIGSITKIENYIDDAVQLVSDIQGSKSPAPLRYGSSLSNKISPSTLNMMGEFSKKINTVFRKNLQNIQSTISSSTKAHGSNLVPDSEHFKRMKGVFVGYTQKVQTEFKGLYNVIDFYCKYNPRSGVTNLQFVPGFNVTIEVEGNPINQDLLQNQLADVTSKLTTQKLLA